MNRLIINTANDNMFIVLQKDNEVFSVSGNTKMHHNETMLPMIDKLLTENKIKINDIDQLGVIVGPGSFTGIRVGIATIKAFRDSLNIEAKGINNLDYLYRLAHTQNPNIDTVAILGSKDSYFVAKMINGQVYKYEHNLTYDDLVAVAEGSPIGMFKADDSLNCYVVEDDANVMLECLYNSNDVDLVPVYYQLSQAENEKLKRGELKIEKATTDDCAAILQIEEKNIMINVLSREDIKTALNDNSYVVFKAVFNDEVVGFVIGQICDEINITSIAVNKEYRNLGIATKLIEKLVDYAKDLGVQVISLEVSYYNVNAYVLYKKLGFELRRIRKNYYQDGADCLEMAKQI